jgi:prepilin-type N-terminal cleavage/methylation domain-containing protein
MLIKLNKTKEEKGFTLIELLIVIAIIGFLASIAIPQFAAFRTRSYNAAAESDLKNATTAQETYFVDEQTYAGAIGSITGGTYGFFISTNVTVAVPAANTTQYTMTASHSSGDQTYTITGPGGAITH